MQYNYVEEALLRASCRLGAYHIVLKLIPKRDITNSLCIYNVCKNSILKY